MLFGVFSRVARVYTANYERHPFWTLAVTNAALFTLGDVLAQTVERFSRDDGKPPTTSSDTSTFPSSFDPKRAIRFAVYGAGIAPIVGSWMHFLEHRFPLNGNASDAGRGQVQAQVQGKAREKVQDSAKGVVAAGKRRSLREAGGASMKQLGKRVLADQVIFAPFGMVLFIGAMGVLEGQSLEDIKSKYMEMFVPALLANWKLWPAVQVINFRFMPLRYRVPFASSVGVLWTLYLSLLNKGAAKEQAKRHDHQQVEGGMVGDH